MNDEEIEKRFTSHSMSDDQIDLSYEIRAAHCVVAKLVNKICPESREKSLAMTHLEEAVFWANASIARNP